MLKNVKSVSMVRGLAAAIFWSVTAACGCQIELVWLRSCDNVGDIPTRLKAWQSFSVQFPEVRVISTQELKSDFLTMMRIVSTDVSDDFYSTLDAWSLLESFNVVI